MKNIYAWVLVVSFSLIAGYFGYTVWHDFAIGPVGFSSFFALAMVAISSVIVWIGVSNVDNPRNATITALVLVLVFLILSIVYAYAWSNPKSKGLTASFYITDQWGNVIKASPRTAFNLFDLWYGDTDLGYRFEFDYDCTVKVTGSAYKPDSLVLLSKLSLTRGYSTYGNGGYSDYSFNPIGTAMAPNGWINDGNATWHVDVGKNGAPKVTPWTVYGSDAIWNDYSSYTFAVSLTATVTISGVSMTSSAVTASFDITKKTQFSVALENVNVGVNKF